jgi:hypothetical protein
LLEFAEYEITPVVAHSFKPESINVAPLQDRYIKLQHTIHQFLYKIYGDGTLIFLLRDKALRISSVLSTMRIPKASRKGLSLETYQVSMINPLHT